MSELRSVAVARFGPSALAPGEPQAALRRAFVPIWLLHRYQIEAAAKLVGGVDFTYAVANDGDGEARPVPPADQRRALDALLDTLDPAALTVPPELLPWLSAGWSGSNDRQTEIEVMGTAGGPVFDPLAATETGAAVTLAALLAPERLNRLDLQDQADGDALGAHELVDRLLDRVFAFDGLGASAGAVQRRTATTVALALARVQRDPALSPTFALALSERLDRLGDALERARGGGVHGDWSRGLGRLLGDREALERAVADQRRLPRIPPGMPIGGEGGWFDL
jgi:hypothetical protein